MPRKKKWYQIKDGSDPVACDQCNEDIPPCCPSCGKFDEEAAAVWTNDIAVLCGYCYPLTMVEYYDKESR